MQGINRPTCYTILAEIIVFGISFREPETLIYAQAALARDGHIYRMDFSALAGASLAAVVALLWWHFHVPSNLPANIPRIPIYGWALGIWWGMSHAEVYDRWVREPLEKHGAVIVWFAGRWNILVGDPALLVEMFRNHGLYTKAGNQVRVPWSVLGAFVGDNIVNAHGSNWELYTSVMKPGIQRPFDPAFIRSKSQVLVDRLIHTQKEAGSETGVLVAPWLQKFTVDVMANYFFDLHLQVRLSVGRTV